MRHVYLPTMPRTILARATSPMEHHT